MVRRSENVDDYFCPLSKAELASLSNKPQSYPNDPAYLFHPFIIDLYSLSAESLPNLAAVDYNNSLQALLKLSLAFEKKHEELLQNGLRRHGPDTICAIYHQCTMHNNTVLRKRYLGNMDTDGRTEYDTEILCRIVACRFRWELWHGTEWRVGAYNQQGCPDKDCAGHLGEITDEPNRTDRAREFLKAVRITEGSLELVDKAKVIELYPEFGNNTLRNASTLNSFHSYIVEVVFRNSRFFEGQYKLWGTRLGEYLEDMNNEKALLKRIVMVRLSRSGILSRVVIPYTKNGECVLLWKTPSFNYESVGVGNRGLDVYLPRFQLQDLTDQKVAVYLADQEIQFCGSGGQYSHDWPSVDAFKTFLKGYNQQSDSDLEEPKRKKRLTQMPHRQLRPSSRQNYKSKAYDDVKNFGDSEDDDSKPLKPATNTRNKVRGAGELGLASVSNLESIGDKLTTELHYKNELRTLHKRLDLMGRFLEDPTPLLNAIRNQKILSTPPQAVLPQLFGGHASLGSLLSNYNDEQLEQLTVKRVRGHNIVLEPINTESKWCMEVQFIQKKQVDWDSIENSVLEDHRSVEETIAKVQKELESLIAERIAPKTEPLDRSSFEQVADSVWEAFLGDEDTEAILQIPNPTIRDLRLKRKLAKMGKSSWSNKEPYRSSDTVASSVLKILKHPNSQRLGLSEFATTIAPIVYQNVLKSKPEILQADAKIYISSLVKIIMATIVDLFSEEFDPAHLVQAIDVVFNDERTVLATLEPPNFDSKVITESFTGSSANEQAEGRKVPTTAMVENGAKSAPPPPRTTTAATLDNMTRIRRLNPRDPNSDINLVPLINHKASLGQQVGQVNNPACKRCIDGYGKWVECVSVKNHMAGACANCHFNNQSFACSLQVKKS